MLQSNIFIPRKLHGLMLEAIKRLDAANIWPDSRSQHFAFVESKAYENANSVHEAMKAWRWFVDCDDEDNIITTEFLGEKLGDEDILFEAIAPFVRDGSTIQMAGEDGKIWRWIFHQGTVQQQEGRVVFPPPNFTLR